MSLSSKVKVRPYICGVFLCFNASFTASTSFQNFYDTDIFEADVVSLYATSSKVKFTETKISTRAGYQYKQNISISLPIADELRSEHITRIHQAEQVVIKLTNGEYLFLGRNDAKQNTRPKVSYTGNAQNARLEFVNTSMAASGYTDIDSIDEIPDDFLFVLLDNGVTIRYLGNTPGDTGLAFGDDSGIVYTAVNNFLFEALDENTNYASICTTLMTSLDFAFTNYTGFNQNVSHFDTTNIISFQETFRNTSFNQDVSFWDMSNAINIRAMFRNTPFNYNINNWDVSSVKKMNGVFGETSVYNQPLDHWDVRNVEEMGGMFSDAQLFNQPLNSWITNSLYNLQSIFRRAYSFNQPLSNWNVSGVNQFFMTSAFLEATSYNQDLSTWCVEQIQTQPVNFDAGATAWTQPKPNWGAPC